MRCQHCGDEVGDDLKFCTSCGAPVAVLCPGCGTAASRGQRFCGHCGTALDDGAASADAAAASPHATGGRADEPASSPVTDRAPARERKVATIVFADLVGFTSLGERADPELVQSLVTRAFDRLSAEVARYEGLIEKFAGDAMLAVFGVPAVHEDDPERAVRAALEMQRAMSRLGEELRDEGHDPLRLRIGIETGEVLVDQARAANERDRMVTGDPVNTAARLQQAAEPEQVVVGPSTYAATRELVRYDELEPLDLKGKGTSVAAWRAIEVDTRRDRRHDRTGIQAPLLGRDAEISLLQDTLRRTASDRRPHLVTVLGDAGVGKSRLVWELEKYVDGLPETWHWRVGRALAYGQPVYGAVADVAKADAHILDDDPPTVVHEKLRVRVGELEGSSAELAALTSLLVTDAEEPSSRDPGGLFGPWQRYLERVADRHPLVLVFEDLHWADDGTLDFVESLARWGAGPIAIVAMARHELADRRPGWGGGVANASTLALKPLDQATAERVLERLVGSALPDEARARIIGVAEGNPLFLEELVRTLVDRGVVTRTAGPHEVIGDIGRIDVPDTIQALLAARIDALHAEDKTTLQAATVVGRTFWTSAVAALTDRSVAETREALRRLRAKELITAVAEPALAGEEEYRFRHALVRDVAYEALPLADRATRHARIAEWARRRFAERDDDVLELVAEHLLDAVRYGERAPTQHDADTSVRLRTDAFEQAGRAGRRAASLGQIDRGARWLRAAVELGRELDLPAQTRVAVATEHLEIARLGQHQPDLGDLLEEALALAGEPGVDAVMGARLVSLQSEAWFQRGDPDGAARMLRDAIARLSNGPSSARALLRRKLGWVLWRVGAADDAVPLLEDALAEARATGDGRTERWALHELAMAHSVSGEHERATALALNSMDLARAATDHELVTRCHINVPAVLHAAGRMEEASELTLEGLVDARRGLNHQYVAWLAANLADFHRLHGRPGDARELLLESLAAAELVGDVQRTAMTCFNLSELALQIGDRASATAWLERGRASGAESEHQTRGQYRWLAALLRWPEDPHGAVETVLPRNEEDSPERTIHHAIMAARMGLRLRTAVPQAREHLDRVRDDLPEDQAVYVRWLDALLHPDAPESVERLLACVDDLRGRSEQIVAADAIADAAMLAGRCSHPDAPRLLERARRAFDGLGIVPVLGEVSEDVRS